MKSLQETKLFSPNLWLVLSLKANWLWDSVVFCPRVTESFLCARIYDCDELLHCVFLFKGQSSHSSVIDWKPSEQLTCSKKRHWGDLRLRNCSRSVGPKIGLIEICSCDFSYSRNTQYNIIIFKRSVQSLNWHWMELEARAQQNCSVIYSEDDVLCWHDLISDSEEKKWF